MKRLAKPLQAGERAALPKRSRPSRAERLELTAPFRMGGALRVMRYFSTRVAASKSAKLKR